MEEPTQRETELRGKLARLMKQFIKKEDKLAMLVEKPSWTSENLNEFHSLVDQMDRDTLKFYDRQNRLRQHIGATRAIDDEDLGPLTGITTYYRVKNKAYEHPPLQEAQPRAPISNPGGFLPIPDNSPWFHAVPPPYAPGLAPYGGPPSIHQFAPYTSGPPPFGGSSLVHYHASYISSPSPYGGYSPANNPAFYTPGPSPYGGPSPAYQPASYTPGASPYGGPSSAYYPASYTPNPAPKRQIIEDDGESSILQHRRTLDKPGPIERARPPPKSQIIDDDDDSSVLKQCRPAGQSESRVSRRHVSESSFGEDLSGDDRPSVLLKRPRLVDRIDNDGKATLVNAHSSRNAALLIELEILKLSIDLTNVSSGDIATYRALMKIRDDHSELRDQNVMTNFGTLRKSGDVHFNCIPCRTRDSFETKRRMKMSLHRGMHYQQIKPFFAHIKKVHLEHLDEAPLMLWFAKELLDNQANLATNFTQQYLPSLKLSKRQIHDTVTDMMRGVWNREWYNRVY